jgi:hypothetical protein
VKDWAKKKGLTYGSALSKPECKSDYNKKYSKTEDKKQEKFSKIIGKGTIFSMLDDDTPRIQFIQETKDKIDMIIGSRKSIKQKENMLNGFIRETMLLAISYPNWDITELVEELENALRILQEKSDEGLKERRLKEMLGKGGKGSKQIATEEEAITSSMYRTPH